MREAWSDRFDVAFGPPGGRLRLRVPVATPMGWLERFEAAFPVDVPERLDTGLDVLQHVRGTLQRARVSWGVEAALQWAAREGVAVHREEGLVRWRLRVTDAQGPLTGVSILFSGVWAVEGGDLYFGLPAVEGEGSVRDGWAAADLAMRRLGARWESSVSAWCWPRAASWTLRRVLTFLGMRLPRGVCWAAPPNLQDGRIVLEWGEAEAVCRVPRSWSRCSELYEHLMRGEEHAAHAAFVRLCGDGVLRDEERRRLARTFARDAVSGGASKEDHRG